MKQLNWKYLLLFCSILQLILGQAMVVNGQTGTVVARLVGCGVFQQGTEVDITIQIDMSGVMPPDDKLGSITGQLCWDPNYLTYIGSSGFLSGFSGSVGVSQECIMFNGLNIYGAGGVVDILTVTFLVSSDPSICETSSSISLDFSAIYAAFSFVNLLPILQIPGDGCDFFVCCGEVTATVECQDVGQGSQEEFSIKIDMTNMNAPNDKLGSFTGSIDWDTNYLTYISDTGILSGFTGNVVVGSGHIDFNGANPSGAGGVIEILKVTFEGVVDPQLCEASSIVDLEISLYGIVPFHDIRPCVTVNDCQFRLCCGILGDVNWDGLCNSTDALIILSCDVGINVSMFCPMNCCDTNRDGKCDSTDALIMLSYDVGIPVPFPVCQPGCCPTDVTPCPGCIP